VRVDDEDGASLHPLIQHLARTRTRVPQQRDAATLSRRRWAGPSQCLVSGLDEQRGSVDDEGIRLHGDCHLGNLLWTEAHGPHFVDLDDCRRGPAIQDLWMIADAAGQQDAETGDDATSQAMQELLAGYEQIRPFERRELALVEPLRTLRIIRHSAWLAERWEDPAFPAAFPWFGSVRYWQGQIISLQEQLAQLRGL